MNRLPALLSVIITLGLVALPASADYDWEYVYDCDVAPTAANPAWTTGGTATISSDGDVLTIDTSTGYGFIQNTAGDWDNGTTAVEIRMNPDNVTEKFYIQVGAGETANRHLEFLMNYSAHYVYISGTSTGFQMPSGYSVVLITLDVAEDLAEVYVGTTNIYSGAIPSTTSYNSQLKIGGNNEDGTCVYDYIKWTTSVPEPMTVSVLAMGAGLVALRRRRNY